MNKYSLITGATGGLGKAYVEECAKRGNNLILTSTSESKLEELKNYVNEKYKDILVFIKACDLSVEGSRNELISFVKENKIIVERLILNAGYITQGGFENIKQTDYLNVVRVNCEGNIDLFNKILNLRRVDERLYVIVVSSFAGFNPMPYMAIYAASKAFLNSFFIAVGQELKNKEVYITIVCPSGMATTQEMKDSIKVQGFGGKITENSVESIAEKSIEQNIKKRPLVVVRLTNKCLHLFGAFVPQTLKAKLIGKRWKKAQEKMSNLK